MSTSAFHQTYTPHQYMILDVASKIAAGATGVVHNATLQVLTEADGVRSLEVVVKFAFKSRQQRKLRHEFSIYEHLASPKVDGIPFVFGLFEDTESATLALVMTHVGLCLLDRGPGEKETTAVNPKAAVPDSSTTAPNPRLVPCFTHEKHGLIPSPLVRRSFGLRHLPCRIQNGRTSCLCIIDANS
jgi:hypothetical protein